MRLVLGWIMVGALSFASSDARAECNCVAVAGDVFAAVQAEVMKADGLYARGDFDGALALYAKAYAESRDAVLLYAQGMAAWQLGAFDKAKASFEAYLKAGGVLAFKARAEAALRGISTGVAAGGVGTLGAVGGGAVGAVGAVGGAGGKLVGGVLGGDARGKLGGTALGGVGAVGGVAHGAVDTSIGAVGGVTADVKPQKIGRKAGIVLGVIAIAAIGAVGIHSIAAGVSTDIELDPKFDLGLGIGGVAVGISAIYVAGLTATTAAVPTCVVTLPAKKPLVAPVAMPGGGGLAAAMSF